MEVVEAVPDRTVAGSTAEARELAASQGAVGSAIGVGQREVPSLAVTVETIGMPVQGAVEPVTVVGSAAPAQAGIVAALLVQADCLRSVEPAAAASMAAAALGEREV